MIYIIAPSALGVPAPGAEFYISEQDPLSLMQDYNSIRMNISLYFMVINLF